MSLYRECNHNRGGRRINALRQSVCGVRRFAARAIKSTVADVISHDAEMLAHSVITATLRRLGLKLKSLRACVCV